MRFRIRFAAALQAVVMLSSLAVAGLGSPQQAHPAGCPFHHHSLPSPAPVKDHSCCQSGHDLAVLQKPALPDHDFISSPFLASDQDPVLWVFSTDLASELSRASTLARKLPIRI